MAEGGEVATSVADQKLILEDYLMMEEEPLVDKTVEEEIDLYINLTLTSAAYPEQKEGEALSATPDQGPVRELEEVVAIAFGEEEKSETGEEEDAMLEDVAENEALHSDTQLRCEAMEEEEEGAVAEQGKDHVQEGNCESKAAEELNNLGDPAVMRAVRGQFSLEREDSAVLDSRIANNLGDYAADYFTASKSRMWSPNLRRVPSLSVLEVLDRACRSPVGLDFLTSPVQTGYLEGSGLDRPAFRGRSLKPSSQRFMRQQSPTMPGSVRSPYPFTPPRRTRRVAGLNQTSGYSSSPPFRPLFPNVNSPSWSLGHTIDSPPFSPSSSSLQKFSLPTAMTQLHPLHQRILTQRQRGQGRRMPSMESRSPKVESCPSLMSAVEKDWVIKVQMLQLQSENPHKDDYYYQEYYRKLEYKQMEKGPLGGGKPDVPKLVTPYIQKVETYESVMRIPGSLGQVAMSTCFSPRRAIDAVHHIQLEQAAGNQRLQVLYQIEKMYMKLLDLEDTRRKLELASEEQHSHVCEKLAHEAEGLYEALGMAESNFDEENREEFLHILLVGKGKKLVARLLPYLSQEQAKRILTSIAHHLPLLVQKDLLDETLPILYHPLRDVIEHLAFSEMINILQEIIGLQPVKQVESVKQSLAMVFGNKFAISLLYLLLSHGERCVSSGAPLNLHNGDFEKWVNAVLLVARELSQVPKASMAEPLHLPSNLLFLFCRYVDRDTVNRLDVKME